jgi:hypothetical protein
MLILFDHGAPRGLARAFAGHTVITAKARGWDRLSKGALLTASEAAGIDLLLTPSSGPYLVCGKKVDHFFAGVDSLEHEEKVHVVARWALLGDVYVGIWIEEGTEHLFSFRAPRRRAPARA